MNDKTTSPQTTNIMNTTEIPTVEDEEVIILLRQLAQKLIEMKEGAECHEITDVSGIFLYQTDEGIGICALSKKQPYGPMDIMTGITHAAARQSVNMAQKYGMFFNDKESLGKLVDLINKHRNASLPDEEACSTYDPTQDAATTEQ